MIAHDAGFLKTSMTMTLLYGMTGSGGSRKSARSARTALVLFCLAVALFFLLPIGWSTESLKDNKHGMTISESIHLPQGLEGIVLTQFDDLVSTGDIFWESSSPEHELHNGFQFEFRIVPFLDRKPISSPSSPDRTTPGGPFLDPRKEEIVLDVGSSHRLLLNKYCVYRPMLVLPTTDFALQTDDLDLSDIAAAWAILKAFETPQMAIYNCGAAAGSSLGHKHIQIFPLPDKESMPLFPSQAVSTTTISRNISNVPFKHFVLRISKAAQAVDVLKLYQTLLIEAGKALRDAKAGSDYNVVFTTGWIALIPRRTAVWGGPYGANGAGMVGMVTVPSLEQRQQWADLGYTNYLVRLGIPIE